MLTRRHKIKLTHIITRGFFMYKYIVVLLALISSACIGLGQTAHADTFFQGTKQVNLIDNKGNKTSIGSIKFSGQDPKIKYTFHIDHSLFNDFFLSMKEMKCLEGPELWCHLAYPYNNPQEITSTDFRWLSHDLLFMYKKKTKFGANFDNGIYYDFKLESGRLIGTAKAMSLNLLAAPPEDKVNPPVGEYDIDDIMLSARWLPIIEIM